ncbi:MAG: hypothetical protein Q8L48_25625 [Archangium sp.]|jgi:hypothetical protein|nr:hypothetical protein [Archangium sp.]
MKVKELMELLKDLEPNAQVLIASQPNWPFEIELSGVVTRAECSQPDEDGEGDAQAPSRDGAPTDVFLVEGQQLRYGSKTPFRLARRSR